MNIDRARGALLGLAVGDALGTTLEFSSAPASLPAFPTLATGPHRDVVGKGPFRLAPGQVTDDTQMACLLARLVRDRASFDPEEASCLYGEWASRAFDVGTQTAAALARAGRGVPALTAGRETWAVPGRRPAGNGSLMRTAPIGVFLAGDPDARRRAALLDSAVTHHDPRCLLACAAFDAAIARAVAGAPPVRPGSLLDAARREVGEAAEVAVSLFPGEESALDDGCAELLEDLSLAERDDPGLTGRLAVDGQAKGFVRVSFRLAFWELLHAPSFEAGLVDAVNRCGDADTNGAIAGALLGAMHGERAIPARWSEPVLSAPPHPSLGRLAEACLPRTLLEGLGRAPGEA